MSGVAEPIRSFEGRVAETRKVTVNLSADLLDGALHASGKGVTDTIRDALKAYTEAWAFSELAKLKGKIHISDEEWRWMAGKDED